MPDDYLITLGEGIRKARNAHKYTQDELSDKSGVATRTIAKIEKGQENPSFTTLMALVQALEISLDTLFRPADAQEDAEIKELTDLYRACPADKRQVILASTRTLSMELKALDC